MSTQTPIEEYLMTSESKAVKVLLWLLKNRDKDNIVHTTIETAALECSITKVTVNRVFQKLYVEGFMEKMRNGKYKLKKV
jgi:DNA-binding MurR/RpiR family transcriptional regulator